MVTCPKCGRKMQQEAEACDICWLKSDLAQAEKRLATVEGLLLYALMQGTSPQTDGEIDTQALSTWEEIAEYLGERGVLEHVGGRMWKRKGGGA